MKGEADIAYGYKERNFWNCSARVLGSVIEPDEATTGVLGVMVYNPEVVCEH
jgi:hypothetical protein